MRKQLVRGVVKRHPDGFGFLVPEDPLVPDIYLPRHTMEGVMTNDTVIAHIQQERDQRYSGEVKEIVGRAHTTVVGVYDWGTVKDKSHAWGSDLRVEPAPAFRPNNGELVAVKINSYPGEKAGFAGQIVDILGNAQDPKMDTKRVLYENGVPMEFSRKTLKELESLREEPNESDWQGKKDLRNLKFVTIDGVTARDFDDAVYAEKDSRGFRIWVAIADVSHYVKPGTALDQDAYERGTSVYFPDMVVPMLPEKISNGLCSLVPHKNRLVLVAEILIDHEGNIIDSSFYDAVFESHHRLTYGIVQEMIDGKNVSEFEDVRENLELMRDIAKILMRKRFIDGSLDLELPEAELLIDESGNPIDIIRSDRLFSHRLIEEFMLLANVAVARFIRSKDVPCLYRVHEDPFPEALQKLEVLAWNWGVHAKFDGSSKLQKKLMRMLEKVKGTPKEQILSMLVLRSMKQAKYSHEPTGHFGLAFSDYTHFTSPIRRYPDLVVHRVLKQFVIGSGKPRTTEDDKEKIASMGTFLSACEQRANRAERDLAATKRCRFLLNRIGEQFEGMVTGVAKFGFFVQLRAFDVDGLVKLERIPFDRFDFDEDHLKLIGRKTGFVITLGDKVKVQVARVEPEIQQIDFELITEENANIQHQPSNRSNTQERSKASPNSRGFREARLPQHRGEGKAGKVSFKKDNKKRRARKSKRGRKGQT